MAPHCPDRGDVVWLSLDPALGHEQAGRRPAIILSPIKYNRKVGLALACPITSQTKGYPFEVTIPSGFKIAGAILSDQVKCIDWRERQAELVFRAPPSVIDAVQKRIVALVTQ